MKSDTPNWGIEPVPERLRVLGTVDMALLWGNLGVSLLVLVAAAFLVPALSLPEAVVAIVIGALIGNLMLAAAGGIGAEARVPAMVLMRAPLGRRGSYLPTALNVAQCLGWAVFELIIIGAAAAALSDEIFGFEGRAFWTLLFGVAAGILALIGPIGFVRRFVRRFAIWAVLASLLYLSWWAVDDANLSALWGADGEGGSSILLGIDLVVAITVTWIPLAADYTRYARSRRAAFVGTFVGYLVPSVWMFLLGALLVLGRGLSDPVAVPAAVAAAGVTAALALFAVTFDETDEAFANTYSAAVSLQNLLPRMPLRLLVVASATVATVGALTIELRNYEAFLLLLGSFFVPLFGVLLADWVLGGMRYTTRDVFHGPAFRAELILAWLVGFALYQWLHPTGPSWWIDLVERTSAGELEIGATLPSFLAAFLLATAFGALAGRPAPARAS
jgi:putative hydroxymethylpyrimidine transporter CytX